MGAFDEEEVFVIGPDDAEFEVKPPAALPKTFAPPASPVTSILPIRQIRSFADVYNSKRTVEWVIKGLLPTKGLMYVGARSGTGKTILVLQVAVDLIFDRDTMTFKRGDDLGPQKILILSLEMGEEEMKERLRAMYPEIPEDQFKLLTDSIFLYTEPEPFKLWTPDHAAELILLIRKHAFTGVLIDSASVSFAQSLKDDTQVNDTINNLYQIRHRLNVWMIVVSHTRKLPAGIVGNMEDVTVDELFGHSGVAQSASSVLLLHHDKKDKENGKSKVIWLMNVKSRFTAESPPFKAYLPLEPPLQFVRKAPIPLPAVSPEQMVKARKKAREIDFGEVFKVVDLGKMGGLEDDD